MKKMLVIGSACVAGLVFAACKKTEPAAAKPAAATTASAAPSMRAGGTFAAKSGSKVEGAVEFVTGADGLTVNVKVSGATPGTHGLHLHDKGDCSAPDAASAGPHFNPMKDTHGGPATAHHHAGDLGNITVGADGKGALTMLAKNLTFDEVIGKSVVLHEKNDDMATDPSGNSGARQGCAVINKL